MNATFKNEAKIMCGIQPAALAYINATHETANDFNLQIQQLLASVKQSHQNALSELDNYERLIKKKTELFKKSLNDIYNKKHES